MIIIHKIDDFLFKLFPAAQTGRQEDRETGRQGDRETGDKDLAALKEELTKYYTFGPYKPKVEIEDELVKIEIDTATISSQKADFDSVVKYCETGKINRAKPILEKLIKKIRPYQSITEYWGKFTLKKASRKKP